MNGNRLETKNSAIVITYINETGLGCIAFTFPHHLGVIVIKKLAHFPIGKAIGPRPNVVND